MQSTSVFLSSAFVLLNLDWLLAIQIRPTRHTTMLAAHRNSTKLISSMISSTTMPEFENSTDNLMSTTKADDKDEWDYGKKSLTTAKIIFISAFATILIVMLIVTVVWNWKTKQRPVTQEVMTQPATPQPEAKPDRV
ncbi:hypothetical protein M3Y97_00625700 [Aphelenchoides bicaudatus]|nr:hypothetical protein M3Y97_00625700 [Aphelenchoides bicaudatus]